MTISHILSHCPAYHTIRERIFQEFSEICLYTQKNLNFENIRTDSKTLAQFILDPTSFNLKERVHVTDPVVPEIFKLSRDYCMVIYGWCYLSHRGPADYLLYVAQEPANYLLYAGLSAGRYPLLKNRTDLRLRAGHNGTLKQTLIWWSQC